MMAGRSLLIINAWFKSSLLEFGPNSMQVDEIPLESDSIEISNELIAHLAAVSINTEQDPSNMDDEFTDATCSQDALDYHQHQQEIDLFDNPMDEDCEDADEEDDLLIEMDYDSEQSFAPSIATSSTSGSISGCSSSSNCSLDSCGLAQLTRAPGGGGLVVSFEKGAVLDPQLFLDILKTKLRNSKDVEIIGVSSYTPKGYSLMLKGVQHGSVAEQHPALVWLPHEVKNIVRK
jgi:hypothetical protein